MKLRFVRNEKISGTFPVSFNRIADEIKQSFVQAVESASRVNAENIDWWVSSPASRNIVLSPLYYYCCCIAYVKACVNMYRPNIQIQTDSPALKSMIERYLGKHNRIEVSMVRLAFGQGLKKFIQPIYQCFKIPFLQLLFYTFAKLTPYRVASPPVEPITLIDTFVMPGFIEKDRYFTGMFQLLNKKEKKSCWFVPLSIGFKPWQYLGVVKVLRSSKRHFLLKEDYLKVRDYLYAWAYVLRIFSIRRETCMFDGIDIWPLIREELASLNGFESSFNALLNYCFAKRLKENGIKLRLVVDWFENQSVDRGWNAGFRKFFPNTKTQGYLGYIPNVYPFFMHPTQEEMRNNIIPHEIIVIGEELVKSVKTFCTDVAVRVGPAFRFQGVFRKRRFFPSERGYKICVALPIRIDEATYILRIVVKAIKRFDHNEPIRLWIKTHPAVPASLIRKPFVNVIPEQFTFIDHNENFNDRIEKANLLISSGSSTCAETLAKGIPVVVVLNRTGMNQSPIPESISEDILRVCFTTKEIAEAIRYYINTDSVKSEKFKILSKTIRQKLFRPVTRDSVREFLDF